jgi:hypothetical protein
MVEKSMFQRKKVKRRRKKDAADDEGDDVALGADQDDGEDVLGNTEQVHEEEARGDEEDSGSYEWVKKVDINLRKWIETEGCRRDVTDEYFANPPNRQRE